MHKQMVPCSKEHFPNRQELENRPLIFILNTVSRLHFSNVHSQLAKIGVYRGQPRILEFLSHKDGVSQKELSDALNLTQATITDTLQRMEKAGLLERRPDPDDRRISRVYRTEKGKEVDAQVRGIFEQMEEMVVKGLTDEEKAMFRRVLLKMIDNLYNLINE